MQTIHDRSLDWMNRGHHHDAMVDAVERSRGRGFEIGAHIMLGLPGESHDDMLATAREVGRLGLDAVKIHNLYCVKNTPLADQVARGEVRLMERAEYVRTVVDFIELTAPDDGRRPHQRRRPARLFHRPQLVPRQAGGESGCVRGVRAPRDLAGMQVRIWLDLPTEPRKSSCRSLRSLDLCAVDSNRVRSHDDNCPSNIVKPQFRHKILGEVKIAATGLSRQTKEVHAGVRSGWIHPRVGKALVGR